MLNIAKLAANLEHTLRVKIEESRGFSGQGILTPGGAAKPSDQETVSKALNRLKVLAEAYQEKRADSGQDNLTPGVLTNPGRDFLGKIRCRKSKRRTKTTRREKTTIC